MSKPEHVPQNLEAEKNILTAVLQDNQALAVALKTVSSGDFFFHLHQSIFRHMIRMAEAGTPIDLVMLHESMSGSGELGNAVDVAYVAALTDLTPRISNVAYYAEIVHQKARLRRLAIAGDRLSRAALDADVDDSTLEAMIRDLSELNVPLKVAGGNGKPLTYSLDEFMAEEFPTPEHLVEQLIPKSGTVMVVAMPHHLKSWFTTSLALATTVASDNALGKLKVPKPVRTMLVQVEEFPGELQGRLRKLLHAGAASQYDRSKVRIFPRCNLQLPDERWYQNLLREIEAFEADHVILDVLRRIFRGDINSQKDTTLFLEQLERLREATSATLTLVHHENRKEADLLYASAGSYTIPSWANVVAQFKRKQEENGVSHVEIEVDNKLAPRLEPMRLVLDLDAELPVRLENLEDSAGIQDLRDQLGEEFTLRDIQEVLGVARTNTQRRVRKLVNAGLLEKVGGKRGRGGLARYHWVGSDA